MNTDAELLRQYLRENSQPAFAGLVRRHVDLVYSVALRKVGGDAHAARDVAQGVFVALARHARSLTSRTTLAGWLYVTSRQQAAQLVRSERRRQNREHAAHTMNEIFNTPGIDWDQLRPLLDDTLQELGEAEREAILLRYFERQPFSEIGRALLVSEDAARMRVDRGLEKLRTLLARRGVASTAAVLGAVLGQQVTAAPATLTESITHAVASAIPAAAGTKTSMSIGQLLTGGTAIVVIASAVIFSRETRPHTANLLVAPPSSAVPTPRTVTPTHATVLPAAAKLPTESRREDTPPRQPNPADREEREPRPTDDLRSAEFDRQLGGFHPLLEKLDFTPTQRETFNALVTANLRRHSDLREFARTQGARPVDPDVSALDAEADAQLATQIRSAFGDAVAAAFQHFNETGPMRELVYHLTQALAASPNPLSPAQAEQLIEVLAAHNRAADGHVSGDPSRLDLEAAAANAQPLLTPPQIEALRQLHAGKR